MLKLNKRGFSLLELLLVMGIIAALIIGAFMIYPKVKASQNVSNESKNLSSLVAGIKSLYKGKADYEGLNNDVVLNSKIVPDNMISDGRIVNVWGGDVTIDTFKTFFRINYKNMQTRECMDLASSQYTITRYIDFGGIYYFDTSMPSFSIDGNMAKLADACGRFSKDVTFAYE